MQFKTLIHPGGQLHIMRNQYQAGIELGIEFEQLVKHLQRASDGYLATAANPRRAS